METENALQGFLIQKLIELCYNRSLDSYRAKYLNPLQSVKEFYELIHDWELRKIKNFRTLEVGKNELLKFLEEEEQLKFESVSKQQLILDLGAIKESSKDFELIEYQLYMVQVENKEYLRRLIEKLDAEFEDLKSEEDEVIQQMIRVDRLINYIITEAISLNFSKSYLYKLVQAIFKFGPSDTNFSKQYLEFKNVLLDLKEEAFTTIFKIRSTESQLKNIQISEFIQRIDESVIGEEPKPQVTNFVKEKSGFRFIVFENLALDYYQALKKAKSDLSKLLDKIHLGYSNLKLELADTAVLINKENKSKGDIQPLYYQIDGYYKSNEVRFQEFQESLNQIEENKKIAFEVKDRIISALRHLRLGNEAFEIEKKFINYWIGLEYLFSNYNKDTSTFSRLIQYFPVLHGVYYIKRNCLYFHELVNSSDLPAKTKELCKEIANLSDSQIFDTIKDESITSNPILRFRAQRLKSHLTINSEKRKDYLKNHRGNVENHLHRLYRIRNKIIHDAAIIDNLESLTGNLRYYLSFTLNKGIEYFVKCDSKPIASKMISMDDFFVHHQMLWNSLEQDKFPLEKLLKMEYSMDFLS